MHKIKVTGAGSMRYDWNRKAEERKRPSCSPNYATLTPPTISAIEKTLLKNNAPCTRDRRVLRRTQLRLSGATNIWMTCKNDDYNKH